MVKIIGKWRGICIFESSSHLYEFWNKLTELLMPQTQKTHKLDIDKNLILTQVSYTVANGL